MMHQTFFIYLRAILLSIPLFANAQEIKPDSIVFQIDFCRDPISENCYQLNAEKSCLDGVGVAVFSAKIASNSIKDGEYYLEGQLLKEIEKWLTFLNIAASDQELSLLQVLDLDEFWMRYYSFRDKKNRRQRIGVVFPK